MIVRHLVCALMAAAALLSTVAALAQSTASYTYDTEGRLVTTSYPGGVSSSYSYDGADNRIRHLITGASVCSASDPDSDADGIPDCFELRWGLSPTNPADAAGDLDGDGLSNIAEYRAGTNATTPDSDGDGMPDAFEVRYRLDPNRDDSQEDRDHDGISNYYEYLAGTPPAFDPAMLMPILQLLLE